MSTKRTLLAIALLLPITAYGQLKDPRHRDEDISATQLTVRVADLGDGFHEYLYDLHFPEHNLGTVGTIWLDIACDRRFDAVEFPARPDPELPSWTPGGAHVPVQVDRVAGTDVIFDERNPLRWSVVDGRPGAPSLTLRLVSPAPPGLRHYELEPFMSSAGWDYPELEEHPEIPWVDDFKVTGQIAGPACEPDSPPPRFSGPKQGLESDETNQLLTYRQPIRSRWHAEPGETSVTFDVVYSEMLDPDSFTTTPAWLRRHFNPEPGSEERVVLPLQPGINTFQLQARSRDMPAPANAYEARYMDRDRDEFEIRLTP